MILPLTQAAGAGPGGGTIPTVLLARALVLAGAKLVLDGRTQEAHA
jgi:hypothetical protein